jgi:hypothetical protein
VRVKSARDYEGEKGMLDIELLDWGFIDESRDPFATPKPSADLKSVRVRKFAIRAGKEAPCG